MAKRTLSLTSLTLFVLTSAGVGVIDPTHTVIATAKAAAATNQQSFPDQFNQYLENGDVTDAANLLQNATASQLSSISINNTQNPTMMTTMANAIEQAWWTSGTSQFTSIVQGLSPTVTTATFDYAINNFNNHNGNFEATAENMMQNLSSTQWANLDPTTLASKNVASIFNTVYANESTAQFNTMINGLNSNPANAGAVLTGVAQYDSGYTSVITSGLSDTTFSDPKFTQSINSLTAQINSNNPQTSQAAQAAVHNIVSNLSNSQYSNLVTGIVTSGNANSLESILATTSPQEQGQIQSLSATTLSSPTFSSAMGILSKNSGQFTNFMNDLNQTQLNAILPSGYSYKNGNIYNSNNQIVSASDVFPPPSPSATTMGATSPSMKSDITDSALESNNPSSTNTLPTFGASKATEEALPAQSPNTLSPQQEQSEEALAVPERLQ
ncbi:hypothetical protein [Legionella nagasakiensis]|uniref:hypothetical protein n=1 Tax=Legionella nagasakiensis TaxID=535290 RepID=UPI001056D9DE|nr:hypothetical protein [Legionella nagasakiensis]